MAKKNTPYTTHYSGKHEQIREKLVRMRWRFQPSCLYKDSADKYGKFDVFLTVHHSINLFLFTNLMLSTGSLHGRS
jgi:hypothetical protein